MLQLCPWSWNGLRRVIIFQNSQFYRNSSFAVPGILNNLFRTVVPLWHLLTSSPGKHGQKHESLIRPRKGQVILILLCKRALYCQNQTSTVGIGSNMTCHFRAHYQIRLLRRPLQAEIGKWPQELAGLERLTWCVVVNGQRLQVQTCVGGQSGRA